MTASPAAPRLPRNISREFVTGAVTGAAALLLVGTGGAVLLDAIAHVTGDGTGIDHRLIVAMLLNVALILFGVLRYRALSVELNEVADAGMRDRILAQRDPLTGFLNRRSLSEDGATLFGSARRRGKAVAMLMIDIDLFKGVNDLHGYAIGDLLLIHVAETIAAIVPGSSLLARLGADEFACAFIFDPSHQEVADRIAERLVAGLATPFRANGIEIHTSASIGVARSDADCASIDALLRTADIALHAARTNGRNRHAWFSPSMERTLQLRGELETGLRHAIPAQQIIPCFEQQVDLATGRVTGFEVLARWEHPTRGTITPDVFIPIAEEIGAIGDLSLSIMRQAFTAARDWDAALTLSVNISPLQLRDAWLAQKIIKTLVETGFPASRLEIEITESALFDNLPLAQSIVGSLKNQGIRLALDDFGTGYSSLAHLRALPFDRIKIDKSFVASILENPESMAIVNTIARLGDSLNLPTTAEGIEDAAVEERLCAIGCAKGQGYLYGRPLNAAQVRRMLAEKRLLAHQPDSEFPALRDSSPRLAS
ncbi:putative bifunctional diguanylate cyclase/phosphodiesterase [Sphingomonas sp. Leaf20]|jgi:diguanylate cyclase (GGDEF)-like protein|uniref:putative bifunctional diguanylate cyclase/phosphodiesterase n=1 Tax=Sphingomonas sp. Leaf20 TaxID=1735685 RepID=UPI0006F80306|nr:EAL domain-containing protein [Sphingomonas sp. Leaf20]KQM73306.1 diguanylate cyclase [Sphingomonas sp. Leaf20]